MTKKKMKELREDVEFVITQMFATWDFADINTIKTAITDDVVNDVIETSDYPNYNCSDIIIAVKRTIVNRLSEE